MYIVKMALNIYPQSGVFTNVPTVQNDRLRMLIAHYCTN